MSRTEQVRRALKETGKATASQVADHLQVQTFKERKKVTDILQGLVKRHEAVAITHLGETNYRLSGQTSSRGTVQEKLWRFACHRARTARPFTVAEAARMAECNLDYVKRYCRWMWKEDYLALAARGRAGAALYQVVGGKEQEPAPVWNRRAEKRESRGQGSGVRGQEKIPSPQEVLNAALGELTHTIMEMAGGCERAAAIIREMNETLLTMMDHDHDEPIEPTECHH
jgi:hypothetical protein